MALIAISACTAAALSAQAVAPAPTSVTAQVTVTSNGMSTVPAFTLGRPAALGYLFVRRGAFAFEPEFRTGLDGKPWALIIWGRYRLQRERWNLGISAHPAINFRSTTMVTNGVSRDMIVARRYLVGELTPTYLLSRYAAIGLTYLYLHGVESDVAKHTHFLSLRSAHPLPLASGFTLRIAPQLYYLTMAKQGGTYAFAQLILAKRGWPISAGTAANKPLHTSIAAGNELTWNVSAIYSIQ